MEDVLKDSIGAFAGALFAFIFFLLGGYFNRARERQKLHHSTLVEFEYQLNEYLNIIPDIRSNIVHFTYSSTQGFVFWSLPRPLPQFRASLVNLSNLKIINLLFNLGVDINKANGDIENLNRGYDELKSVFHSQKIDKTQFIDNSKRLSEGYQSIGKYLDHTLENVITLLARIRVQTSKDKPGFFVFRVHDAVVTDDEVGKERIQLLKEIEDTKTKSRAELDNVFGNVQSLAQQQ